VYAEGKMWKKHRKLTSQVFHYDFISKNLPTVRDCARSVFDRMEKKGLKSVDIMDEFQNITGEAVGSLFFGEDFSDYKIQGQSACKFVADYVAMMLEISLHPLHAAVGFWVFKYGLHPLGKKWLSMKPHLEKFTTSIMKAKSEEFQKKVERGEDVSQSKNLIDLFLHQRRDSPDECYSDIEMLHEFLTFFIAGMDTTGHLLTMASYYMNQNPEIKQKVIDEMNQEIKGDEGFTNENLGKLNYMTAVFKESLRLGSPAPMVFYRKTLKDITLAGDFKIKEGTYVTTAFHSLNYSPEYHDEPAKFDPNRWIDTNSKTYKVTQKNPFVFTPFSAGGRNCIG